MKDHAIVEISEFNELNEQLSNQQSKVEKLTNSLFALQKELSELKRETADLYDYNPSIFFTLDTNCMLHTLNFKAAQFLGFNRDVLINKSFLNYISPHSQSAFTAHIQNLLTHQCKQSCDIEIMQQGGILKYVTLECSLIKKNKFIRVCLTDTSAERALKLQSVGLEKSLNLIHRLFQGSNDAIAALDHEFNFKVINDAFTELFSKIVPVQLTNKMNLVSVLNDFPNVKTKILTACQQAITNKITKLIIENPNKNTLQYYCYEIVISAIQHSEKNVLLFRIRDITDEKIEDLLQHKRQSEIAKSSRATAMGEMVSALAHEINQPLTAIIAYSRSCLHMFDSKQTIKPELNLLTPLKKIAVQAELAGAIIHNMKNFMREGNLSLEETNINVLVSDTLAILHYELLDFKLQINLHLMESLPLVMTNKIHIMQVILNLALNSIEALQSTDEQNPELHIETNQTASDIIVHIRDNGPGVPNEYRDKILNTYFTTKKKGTGIGLGICRTLIEEHGGKLSIMQHEKKGAWFAFTLPKQRGYE